MPQRLNARSSAELIGRMAEGYALVKWFAKQKTTTAGLLGIETGPEGIALAHVLRQPNQAPQLLQCVFREATPDAQPALLKSLVEEFGLAGMSVNLVLHPAEYQLLLLDCPDVPAEELRDAIRWRVKDLRDEPIENLIVDAFKLPEDAYRGRSQMAYCAVMLKAKMQAFEQLITGAGLRLTSIDISEMAFRNLGFLMGAEGQNQALLRLRSSEGVITVQNGTDLYMARQVERGLESAEDDFSAVTLEIQRSLDYFESQLGKGYLNRLLLLPLKRDGERAMQALTSSLAVKLQRLDLREVFAGQPAAELDEREQAYCVAAVGAALRQETL